MNGRVETFRRGLFSLHTRRFGAIGEIFVQAIENFDAPESIFHDLIDSMNNERIEVKCSRVLTANSETITVENFVQQCLNNDPDSRPVNYGDRETSSWDCNIQQVKRTEFSRLYYLLFFRDRISVFSIRSEEIARDSAIKYSNKQHKNNEGEGQFHVTNENIQHHIDTYNFEDYTYAQLIELFED